MRDWRFLYRNFRYTADCFRRGSQNRQPTLTTPVHRENKLVILPIKKRGKPIDLTAFFCYNIFVTVEVYSIKTASEQSARDEENDPARQDCFFGFAGFSLSGRVDSTGGQYHIISGSVSYDFS